MTKIHFRPTIPTKPFFSSKNWWGYCNKKETIQAWLTPWLRALNLESFRKLYKECGRSPYHPRMMSRSFCMPIWTTSTPCWKIEKSFTVTSIISGWPDMRNRISLPSTVSATGEEGNQRGVYANRSSSFFQRLHQPEWEYIDGTKIESKANKYTFVWRKRLSGTVNAWWRRYMSC